MTGATPSTAPSDLKAFPIPFIQDYEHVSLDPSNSKLTGDQKQKLLKNIGLLRDTIVFFTASGAARGVSGHTGGELPPRSLAPVLYGLVGASLG